MQYDAPQVQSVQSAVCIPPSSMSPSTPMIDKWLFQTSGQIKENGNNCSYTEWSIGLKLLSRGHLLLQWLSSPSGDSSSEKADKQKNDYSFNFTSDFRVNFKINLKKYTMIIENCRWTFVANDNSYNNKITVSARHDKLPNKRFFFVFACCISYYTIYSTSNLREPILCRKMHCEST